MNGKTGGTRGKIVSEETITRLFLRVSWPERGMDNGGLARNRGRKIRGVLYPGLLLDSPTYPRYRSHNLCYGSDVFAATGSIFMQNTD